MNKQIKALKMAIKMLEGLQVVFLHDVTKDNLLKTGTEKTIQDCKEALAEAEQKEKQKEAFAELVKLNQEMGGYEAEKQEIGEAEIRQMLKEIEWCHQEIDKKEWHSLSDDEIDNLYKTSIKTWDKKKLYYRVFSRAIEKSLKEKNHG